jgi:hypothetical protein
MIYYVYSVYDEKVKTFGNPFYKPTNPAAIRDFADLAKDQNTTVGRHPEDYTLYQIGEYDDQTGLMTPYEKLNNLGKADQYLEE